MDKLLTFLKEKYYCGRISVSQDEIPNPACTLNYTINSGLVSGFREDPDPVTVSSHC